MDAKTRLSPRGPCRDPFCAPDRSSQRHRHPPDRRDARGHGARRGRRRRLRRGPHRARARSRGRRASSARRPRSSSPRGRWATSSRSRSTRGPATRSSSAKARTSSSTRAARARRSPACSSRSPAAAASSTPTRWRSAIHPRRTGPRARASSASRTRTTAPAARVFPQSDVVAIAERARAHGLGVHLDGARIWNASVATGLSRRRARRAVRHRERLLLEGPRRAGRQRALRIARARSSGRGAAQALGRRHAPGRHPRRGGAASRSAIIASDCGDDHAKARRFAERMAHGTAARSVDLARVETNIVNIDLDAPLTGEAVVAAARELGLAINASGPRRLRAVMHLDVDADDVDAAPPMLLARGHRRARDERMTRSDPSRLVARWRRRARAARPSACAPNRGAGFEKALAEARRAHHAGRFDIGRGSLRRRGRARRKLPRDAVVRALRGGACSRARRRRRARVAGAPRDRQREAAERLLGQAAFKAADSHVAERFRGGLRGARGGRAAVSRERRRAGRARAGPPPRRRDAEAAKRARPPRRARAELGESALERDVAYERASGSPSSDATEAGPRRLPRCRAPLALPVRAPTSTMRSTARARWTRSSAGRREAIADLERMLSFRESSRDRSAPTSVRATPGAAADREALRGAARTIGRRRARRFTASTRTSRRRRFATTRSGARPSNADEVHAHSSWFPIWRKFCISRSSGERSRSNTAANRSASSHGPPTG